MFFNIFGVRPSAIKLKLRPSEIRFSQNSISNVFDKKSLHADACIGETLDSLLKGECDISDIPTITVVKKNEVWYTTDNRRLWVFRKLEEFGKCSDITVKSGKTIPSRKLTTKNDGTDIRVRRDPGGCYWRRTSDDQSSDDDKMSDCHQSKDENDSFFDDENYLDGYTSITVQNGFICASKTFTTIDDAPSGQVPHDEAVWDCYRHCTSSETPKGYLISSRQRCKRPEATLYMSSLSQTHSFFTYIFSNSHSLTIEPLDSENFGQFQFFFAWNLGKAPLAGFSRKFSKSILVCRANYEYMTLEGNRQLWSIQKTRQSETRKTANDRQYSKKHYFKRRWTKKKCGKHQHSKNLHLQCMSDVSEEIYDDDQYHEDLFIDDMYNEDFFKYEDLNMDENLSTISIHSDFDYNDDFSSDEYRCNLYGYTSDEFNYEYMYSDSDDSMSSY